MDSKVRFNTGSFILDSNYVIKSYNEEVKKLYPSITIGETCYKSIYGYSAPCTDCPLFTKKDNSDIIHENPSTRKKMYCTFSNMQLENGENGYIVNCYEAALEDKRNKSEFTLMQHKMDIYRQANYNYAYLYFEVNLTKNIIITDIIEVIDNVEEPLDMVKRGFVTKPISYSDFTEWRLSRGVVSNHDEYRAISSKENLIKKFREGENNQNIIFRARSTNGYPVWQEMSYYLYNTDYDNDIYALCVLRDISRKLEIERSTRRNEEVMRILASEYASILYFDLETRVVTVCSLSNDVNDDIRKSTNNLEYKDLWKLYLNQMVKNSDREKMEIFADVDYLKTLLKNKKTFTYIFRIGNELDYKYRELKIVKTNEINEEPTALVIGIADRNEAIVTQQEQQKQLEYALLLAQKDSLTGIRNRTAYDLAEQQLDEDIKAGTIKEYAILMCDVNRLKMANDQYGHDKGNELLINSSALICSIFKHSMVCRIGGDEFVAILKGPDFDNRYELLERLRNQIESNEQTNLPIYKKISLATGLADYDPIKDKCADDVFHRADTLMYKNKAELKNKYPNA